MPVIESWNFRVTFAENIFLMMTREEGAEFTTDCKKNHIPSKFFLKNLNIIVFHEYP